MRAKGNRLDVVYEARFSPPAVDFAADPRPVLKSIVASVSSRFPVTSQDISITPSNRVSDVRLRVGLFNGQAAFEVDADKIGASFTNAQAGKDVNTIKECLQLGLDGIAKALPNAAISEHSIRLMVWLELLDEPKDAKAFLSTSLSRPEQGALQRLPNSEAISFTPILKFELDNTVEKWVYTFELTRAYRSTAELFQSVTLVCLSGGAASTLEERIVLLEKLLVATYDHVGLTLSSSADAAA